MSPEGPGWSVLNFVADFGDAAAIAPALAISCLTLWIRERRRPALVWTASFAVCVAVTFLAKSAVGASGFELFSTSVEGPAPSGHTAISLTFYGVFAVLLRRAIGGRGGALAAAAAITLNAGIVAAIVALDWHPWVDVLLGAAIGGGCAAAAGLAVGRDSDRRDAAVAAIAAGAVILLLHGARLDTDDARISIQYEPWPDPGRAEARWKLRQAQREAAALRVEPGSDHTPPPGGR